MFTSSADVFRTRQAVADLLEVVRLHRNAVSRIGASNADAAVLDAIVQNGGIFPDEKPRCYASILLSAATPDEDFNGFIASTALLLSDRLQGGSGRDDLFWNYEAFKDHYLLADAPVRAALMNGFRTGRQTGRCMLSEEPPSAACFTRPAQDVVQILRSEKSEDLIEFVAKVPSPLEAGQRWKRLLPRSPSFAESVAYRFLYERPASIHPEAPEETLLIPWV